MKRDTFFKEESQLSLGEIIEKIEKAGLTKGNGGPKSVMFDFGTAIPTTLASWRGSYSELALGYSLTGYDNDQKHFNDITAEALLRELRSGINKTFEGWKGGDFTMYEDTPVWVSNPGNGSHTAIVDVFDDGWCLVLLTAYCEY